MKRTIAVLSGIAILALACGEGDTEEITVGSEEGTVTIGAGEDGAKVTVEQDGQKVEVTTTGDGTKVAVEGEGGETVEATATEEGATTNTPKAGKRKLKGKGL